MHVEGPVGAVVVPFGLAFVVITIVVVVIAVIILIVLNYRNSPDCVANASNARDSTSVKLVVNYRCTNNCGAFR